MDGHAIGVEGEDRSGEQLLNRELNTLYVQYGVEVATDDVSGASLDPGQVREARGVDGPRVHSLDLLEHRACSHLDQRRGLVP